jgi:outer membrane protein assembly factor BamB
MTVAKAKALGMKGLEQKKITEKVKMQHPKVVVTKKAIKFLDEKGEVKSEKLLREKAYVKVASSSNKKYVAVGERFGETIEKKHTDIDEISVMNSEGKVVWKLRDEYPSERVEREWTRVGNFYVSNEGRGAAVISGVIEFYDKNGTLTKKVAFSQGLRHPILFDAAFSEDGEYFVVSAADDPFEGKAYLIVYGKNGEKRWEKTIEMVEGYYNKVETSKYGDFIVAGKVLRGKGIYVEIFNEQGNSLWEYQIGSYGNLTFSLSDDEQYLLIGSSVNQLILFRLKDGKLLWNFSDRNIKNVYFAPGPIVISHGNKYILVSGFVPFHEDITSQYIYLLDLSGNLVWCQYLGKREYCIPSVSFTSDEKGFSFTISNKIYRYVIQE